MATIEITAEIRENMTIVLDTLHIICDTCMGAFQFDALRCTGLSRVHVLEAIEALNAEGYCICAESVGYGLAMKGSGTLWMWVDYVKAYEYALYELDEVRELQEAQAAAVAEVERQLGI